MRNGLRYFVVIFLFIATVSNAAVQSQQSQTREWINRYTPYFISRLTDHISPNDGALGSIIAAKSRKSPDYYYHWVRDAGLAIDAIVQIYPLTPDIYKKNLIRRKIFEYIEFSKKIQQQNTLTGLGEPKFYVDGTSFKDPWGRPQNDGPALRALSLIHFANLLIEEGNEKLVREMLYDNRLPASSPIKMDLEYIAHHWRDPSYDLWEEVKGTHFYTLMVIRRALIEGSMLAHRLNDDGAASWYKSQSRLIETEIEKFFDQSRGHFVPTINRIEGIDYKSSQLDIAVILGLLHGGLNDGFLSWDDKRVTATLEKLIGTFKPLYPINYRSIPGVAIGRYPEDRYAGTHFNGGNPWVLCTLAIAESLYRYAEILKKQGNLRGSDETALRADTFVERVRYHSHQDGTLDEQINRDTGHMTSAQDLTWNYAALLTIRKAVEPL